MKNINITLKNLKKVTVIIFWIGNEAHEVNNPYKLENYNRALVSELGAMDSPKVQKIGKRKHAGVFDFSVRTKEAGGGG